MIITIKLDTTRHRAAVRALLEKVLRPLVEHDLDLDIDIEDE